MKPFFFTVLILLSSLFTDAQSITGVVTNATTNQEVPYASVILKSNDGVFLEGVITDEKGLYLINYKAGKYKLHVSFIGFEEFITEVIIIDKTTLNIGLVENSTLLNQVTIVSEQTEVTQLIDKKVINVGKDILGAGGSAATVLNQLSEVKIDESGNIALRGSQNVNLLINGKPSPLSAAEALQQIPASEILQIEIITSPSAKYRANGMAGIINIITKKKVQKGVSLTLNSKVNSLGAYGLGINYSYGKSKINYRLGGFYKTNISKRDNFEERLGTLPYTQKSSHKSDGSIKKISAGIDWFPDTTNEFSADVFFIQNFHTLTNDNEISRNDSTFSQSSIGVHEHQTGKVNTNYRHLFSGENHYLELDAQVSFNKNDLTGSFTPSIDVLDNATNNTVLIYNLAADYTKEINEKWSLETGYLFDYQTLENTLNNFSESNEVSNTESFSNQQSVHALYGLTKLKWSKLVMQTGLRAEFYNRNAVFNSRTVNVKNSFNNLFPSVHLSYKLHKNFNLVLSYNRRTSRPTLYQVNPIVTQVNEFMVRRGNEELIPEFSQNFEISNRYKKNKLSISAAFYYKIRENLILSDYTIDSNGVTVTSFINEGRAESFGTDITIVYAFAKWLRSDFSTNYNFEKLVEQKSELANNETYSVFLTLNNRIRITDELKLEISWKYDGPEKNFFTSYNSSQKINFGVRYSILKKKGNISLRVNDVFDSYRYVGTNMGVGFTRNFINDPVGRVVYLSFSYRFTKDKLEKRNRKKRSYNTGVMD